MVHLQIPDEIIDEVRPYFENEWDRVRRETGKKQLSPSQVVIRMAAWVCEIKKKKRAI